MLQVQHPDLPTPRRKNQRTPGLLTREEFKEVVVKVIGTHAYDDQLDNLFMKVIQFCHLMPCINLVYAILFPKYLAIPGVITQDQFSTVNVHLD